MMTHWDHGSLAAPLLWQEASFTQLLLHPLNVGSLFVDLRARPHISPLMYVSAADLDDAAVNQGGL